MYKCTLYTINFLNCEGQRLLFNAVWVTFWLFHNENKLVLLLSWWDDDDDTGISFIHTKLDFYCDTSFSQRFNVFKGIVVPKIFTP